MVGCSNRYCSPPLILDDYCNVVMFCILLSNHKLHYIKLSSKNVVNGGNKAIHRCRKVFRVAWASIREKHGMFFCCLMKRSHGVSRCY